MRKSITIEEQMIYNSTIKSVNIKNFCGKAIIPLPCRCADFLILLGGKGDA